MRHGLIFLASWGALLSWAVLLLLTPALVRAQASDGVNMLGEGLAVAGILLTLFSVRWRWFWWKTKIRAEAWTEGRYEVRDRERLERQRELQKAARR